MIGALEQAWEVFQIIQNEGLAGLWKFISEQVGDLQTLVMDQIREMVIGQVIKAGIDWLIGILGGPAGAFVKAVQAIVRVVTWFVQNAGRLASFVNSVLDSVMAIANGDIGGAASFIEQSLAKALPMVISFLADLLGLGGISQKVQGIIQKVKAPIQKGIDWVVQKAVALGKKLWGMLGGKESQPNQASNQEQSAALEAIDKAEQPYLNDGKISRNGADRVVSQIKSVYPVFKSLSVVDGGKSWDYTYIFRMAKKGKQKDGTPGNNQDQNKQFRAAIQAAERIIGRKISKSEERAVNDAITGQNMDYHDIVAEAVAMYGKGDDYNEYD